MRIFQFVLFLFFSILFLGCQQEEPSDLDQILNRYQTLLLQTAEQPGVGEVQAMVAAQKDDGSWPDINYEDRSRAGWDPIEHLSRINQMALLVAENDVVEQEVKQEMISAINKGLDYWNKGRFQSDNWWYNEIGVPRTMRDIVILLKDRLAEARKKGAIEVINQLEVSGTGANLMWSAELGMHHACLTGSREKLDTLTDKIWGEVTVGAGEGIQEDWSFYQHDERLQQFHYGKSFLQVVTYTSWQLRDTPWAIPETKRDIISNYILKGQQWMCRGIFTVPGTIDRMVSRKGALTGADIRNLLKLWQDVDPGHQEGLEAFLAGQQDTTATVQGYKHFPDADFSVYHRPNASIFLKTISERTLKTESINNENQKGVPYLHSGDHYIIRKGREYTGLQPVWEWSQLPGLTIASEGSQQQKQAFVGGAGNGESGITTMDYVRTRDNQTLSVNKMWGFHNGYVVSLLGGWESSGINNGFTTSLEQARLQGDVQVATHHEGLQKLENGTHHLQNVQWVLHNGIGYIPLNDHSLTIEMGPVTGSWHAINRQFADEPVTEPVFKILMHHRVSPQPGGYVMVLDADVDLLQSLTENPDWEVMANNRNQQWISFEDGMNMGVAYNQEGTAFGEGFKVSHPCVALVKNENIWMADPTHKGASTEVTWQGDTKSINLPERGRILETNLP